MHPSSSSTKSSAAPSTNTSPRSGDTATASTKSGTGGPRNAQIVAHRHSTSAAKRSQRNSFDTQQSHTSHVSSLTATTTSSSANSTTTTTTTNPSSSLHVQVPSNVNSKGQGKAVSKKDGKIGQSNQSQTHSPHTPTPPKPTRSRRFSIMTSPVLKGNRILSYLISTTLCPGSSLICTLYFYAPYTSMHFNLMNMFPFGYTSHLSLYLHFHDYYIDCSFASRTTRRSGLYRASVPVRKSLQIIVIIIIIIIEQQKQKQQQQQRRRCVFVEPTAYREHPSPRISESRVRGRWIDGWFDRLTTSTNFRTIQRLQQW